MAISGLIGAVRRGRKPRRPQFECRKSGGVLLPRRRVMSAIGLIGALALLTFLTMRGLSILAAAPACALVIALTSGVPLVSATDGPVFVTAYMNGFTSFFGDWFFMFLLGAIFGELMALSGAADSVARWIVRRFGVKHASIAVVVACAVLTYGGVSVFIVAFSVYPMAVSLFRSANLPRRFIPGALAFGSVTFTMTTAGSPEIQNLIPMQYLGTSAYAGWGVSLAVAALMAGAGFWQLGRMIRKAVARGEIFEPRAGDRAAQERSAPHPLVSLMPLATVLCVFLLCQYPAMAPALLQPVLPEESLGKDALIAALGAGAVFAGVLALNRAREIPLAISNGSVGAVIAITNTCAVVGFGAVSVLSPAFLAALDAFQNLPGNPLISAALAVTVIAGLTGSASGGQTIALPLIAPHYLDMGIQPAELHRVVAIASGALDSLPHNGYVVTTIRAICGETHAAAYGPVAVLTVVIPMIGLAFAVALFSIF